MQHTLGVKQAFTIFWNWHRITEPLRFCLENARLGANRYRTLRAGFWLSTRSNSI